MKKFFIIFFSFFLFSLSLNASTINEDIDLDDNTHFNYFYESINNTSFYRFINGKSDSLTSYISSFDIPTDTVWFMYAKDFFSPSYINNDFDVSKAYYVIYGFDYSFYFRYIDDSYKIYLQSTPPNRYGFLVYDSDMNLLYSKDTDGYYYPYDYSFEKFIHLSGSLYFSNIQPRTNNTLDYMEDDIRYTSISINDRTYVIKDLKTRSGWNNFWSNLYCETLGSCVFNSNIDIASYGLELFKYNYAYQRLSNSLGSYITRFYSLSEILAYNEDNLLSSTVPDSYTSTTFDFTNKKLLIPKTLDLDNSNAFLYFSSSDTGGINFISYDLLENNLSTSNLQTYTFDIPYANFVVAFNLSDILTNHISDNYYIVYSDDNFTSNTLYYHPDYYYCFDLLSSSNISYINPNDNTEYTSSLSDRQFISNKLNKEMIDKSDFTPVSSNVDLSGILSDAWNNSGSFINASYYVLSLLTGFFNYLPPAVSSVFVLVFVLGMILLIWKLFH